MGVAFSLWIVGLEFCLLGRCWWFSRAVVHWVCSTPFLLICQNSQWDWEMQPAVIHLLQIGTMRSGCSVNKWWIDLVLEDGSWKHLNSFLKKLFLKKLYFFKYDRTCFLLLVGSKEQQSTFPVHFLFVTFSFFFSFDWDDSSGVCHSCILSQLLFIGKHKCPESFLLTRRYFYISISCWS